VWILKVLGNNSVKKEETKKNISSLYWRLGLFTKSTSRKKRRTDIITTREKVTSSFVLSSIQFLQFGSGQKTILSLHAFDYIRVGLLSEKNKKAKIEEKTKTKKKRFKRQSVLLLKISFALQIFFLFQINRCAHHQYNLLDPSEDRQKY
jgi:hypothetical protein